MPCIIHPVVNHIANILFEQQKRFFVSTDLCISRYNNSTQWTQRDCAGLHRILNVQRESDGITGWVLRHIVNEMMKLICALEPNTPAELCIVYRKQMRCWGLCFLSVQPSFCVRNKQNSRSRNVWSPCLCDNKGIYTIRNKKYICLLLLIFQCAHHKHKNTKYFVTWQWIGYILSGIMDNCIHVCALRIPIVNVGCNGLLRT